MVLDYCIFFPVHIVHYVLDLYIKQLEIFDLHLSDCFLLIAPLNVSPVRSVHTDGKELRAFSLQF